LITAVSGLVAAIGAILHSMQTRRISRRRIRAVAGWAKHIATSHTDLAAGVQQVGKVE
jgi:hypothetical protein